MLQGSWHGGRLAGVPRLVLAYITEYSTQVLIGFQPLFYSQW